MTTITDLAAALSEIERLRAECDALFEALQAICDEQDARQGYASVETYDKARAAIDAANAADAAQRVGEVFGKVFPGDVAKGKT